MDTLAPIDPRIWQAVLAGAFVAVGWIVNGWQNRREAAARRAERLRDSHRAIYAEIGTNMDALGGPTVLAAHRDQLVARMRAEPEFVPFVPTERGAPIFTALTEHIHILPRVTIDPIVAYYSQMQTISAVVQDMRSERYDELASARRIAIYEDYIEMKIQAFEYGDYALRMIAAFSEGGKERAQAERQKIVTTDQ